MTLPNFLIIGDLKAGSTSLFQYLKEHPQVFMPELKELRFFSFDPENPYQATARSTRIRTLEDYRAQFVIAGSAKAVGEASPNYLRSPLAAGKIHSLLPDVKLIVSLRNPVDRLFSLYLMNFRNGRTRGTFDECAFSEDATWIKGNACWPELHRYLTLFDRSQVHVVLFDSLAASPAAVFADICGFLDIDAAHAPEFKVANQGGLPSNPQLYRTMLAVRDTLKSFGFAPEPLRRRWSAYRSRSMRKPELTETTRRKVAEICREDVLRTQELLQTDLRSWLEG